MADDEYESELARITTNGPHEIGDVQRAKNRETRDLLLDILPINDIHKVSDCDLIYRFLIAMRWDSQKAADGLRSYAEWRETNNINAVLWEEWPPEVLEYTPQFRGRDVFGNPVYFDRPDPAKVGALLSKIPREMMLRAHYAMMESGRRLCKATGTDRVTCFIDLSLLGASVFTNPSAVGFMKEMSHNDQRFYPENMRTMVITNAGFTFNLLWRIIRPLLDERVQKKIQLISGGKTMQAEVAKWVDLGEVPVAFGGEAADAYTEPACLREARALPCGSPLPPPPSAKAVSAFEDTAPATAAAAAAEVTAAPSDDGFHSMDSTDDEAGSAGDATDRQPVAAAAAVIPPTPAVIVVAAQPRRVAGPKELEFFLQNGTDSDGHLQVTAFVSGVVVGFTSGNRVMYQPGTSDQPYAAQNVFEGGHPLHSHMMVVDAGGIVKYIVKQRNLHKQLEIFRPPSDARAVATPQGGYVCSTEERSHVMTALLQPGTSDKRDWSIVSQTREGDVLGERNGACIVLRKELTLPPVEILFSLINAINELWHF